MTKPTPLTTTSTQSSSSPALASSSVCVHPGCRLFAAVDGFCGAHAPSKSPSHYSASLSAATTRPRLSGARRSERPVESLCRAPKCTNVPVCNGYCELHHGSPVDEDLICRAQGCTFYADVDGFCSAHRPGRPMPNSPNKASLARRQAKGGAGSMDGPRSDVPSDVRASSSGYAPVSLAAEPPERARKFVEPGARESVRRGAPVPDKGPVRFAQWT